MFFLSLSWMKKISSTIQKKRQLVNMGICSEAFKTLGFTVENKTKMSRTRSNSLSCILKTTSNESGNGGRRSSSSSSSSSGSSGNSGSDNYDEEDGKKRHKLIKLRNLKNGGTTIQNDCGEYEYYYEPLETINNPFHTKCISSDKGYSVELKMDTAQNKVVSLADLPTQYSEVTSSGRRYSSSTHIFENSSTSSIPNVRRASEALTNGGVTISGTIVVKSLNEQVPQRLRHQSVALKCFVEEYACFVDGVNSKAKQIKLLNKRNEGDITHLLPSGEIRLDLTDMVDPGSADGVRWLQPLHTYELPFTFTLTPYDFPASVRTYFGNTHYRIESLTQVGNNDNAIDTSLLTDQIYLKRVLPITSTIKYECVQMQGNWNNELYHEILLSSKMIELSNPFEVQIKLLRTSPTSRIQLQTISISLSQTVAIPCINSKTGNPLPTSYLKKNDIEIYRKDMQAQTNNDVLDFQLHELKDLILNEGAASWLRPFYCELSNTCTDRSRLKITHVINVRLTVCNPTVQDQQQQQQQQQQNSTHLTFKIPILLVDHDMTMNLWLPPYVNYYNQGPRRHTCPSELSIPTGLSPPEYSSIV